MSKRDKAKQSGGDDCRPERMPDDTPIYRALLGPDWIHAFGIGLIAFMRRKRDTDGITVLPAPHICFRKMKPANLHGIARGDTTVVRTVTNQITGERLDVMQDNPDHAYIAHAPYYHESPEEAENVATELALGFQILDDEEFAKAKSRAVD